MLRRLTASLAIVAFALPTIGMARSAHAPGSVHATHVAASSPAADMSPSNMQMPPVDAGEHRPGCETDRTEKSPPCDHDGSAACASMPTCVSFAAAAVPVAARSADLPASIASVFADDQPSSESAAPEPPPPRA